VLDDVQAQINSYLQVVKYDNGATLPMVNAPAQFDGTAATLTPAPAHGADTDEVLLEAGLDWDDVVALKVQGVIS
jgi:crotonobetainyl-CoA:carnitine CoA-transferase CaiB-like acyl-CoA transferase